jgi:hypothetical protein
MKWLQVVTGWIGMVIAGMWGGQKNKAVRRFGLPSLAFLTAWRFDGLQWRDAAFLLLIPVLIIGYGENSHLMGFLGNEYAVRGVYAMLLGLPFWFFGWRRGLFASTALAVAFLVQAGSLGKIGPYDILIEDLVRYSVLTGLVAFNIIKRPRV